MTAPPAAPEPSLFGVLLTLSYDGAPFSGYAKQTNGRTIAGELEGAISTVDPRASSVRGVSRTDAGVHARGQLVAFDATREIDPRDGQVAIRVRSYDDTVQHLRNHGIECIESPRNLTPWAQIYVTDPDGNVVEFNTDTPQT